MAGGIHPKQKAGMGLKVGTTDLTIIMIKPIRVLRRNEQGFMG